jgi:uncharacterized membrane protein
MAAREVKRRGVARWLRRKFLTGLIVLLPLVVTVYLLYRIFRWVDGFLEPVVTRYPFLDIPGLGFFSVIVIVFLTGVFGGNFFGRRILRLFEEAFYRIPMVRTLYSAIKQTSEVFFKEERTVFKEVVFVEYPRAGVYVIGLVTSKRVFRGVDGREHMYVTVFLPTAPVPTSGMFLIVPEEQALPSDLSIEDALQMVISGGAVIPVGHGELKVVAAIGQSPGPGGAG